MQEREHSILPTEVIVTDPGVDDTLAILVTHVVFPHPVFMATYGNGPITETATNLVGLSHFIATHQKAEAKPTAVYFGADRALESSQPFTPTGGNLYSIHGPGACEGLFTNSDSSHLPRSSQLYPELLKHEHPAVDIFSFGAVTEVAHLLAHPGVIKKVASITAMGGAIFCQGNVSPRVEANFSRDPRALRQIIQTANKNNIPITIVPLDVTQQPDLEVSPKRLEQIIGDLQHLGSWEISRLLSQLVGENATYTRFYQYKRGVLDPFTMRERRFAGPIVHDLTAVMAAKHPNLFSLEILKVSVGNNGDLAPTTVWMPHDGQVIVAAEILQPHTYWELVTQYLACYR